MTTDIDLVMKVESWEKFNELESTLLKSGKLKKDIKRERFNYNNVSIDIIAVLRKITQGFAEKCGKTWQEIKL